MNTDIFEPLKRMRKAKKLMDERVPGSLALMAKSGVDYLDEMEVDKGIPEKSFDDIQAILIKVFYNRMELSEITEYAQCRMSTMVSYARVLGVSDTDTNYTAEYLEDIDALIRSGKSPSEVFGMLGIDVPKDKLSISPEQRDNLIIMSEKLKDITEDSQERLL